MASRLPNSCSVTYQHWSAKADPTFLKDEMPCRARNNLVHTMKMKLGLLGLTAGVMALATLSGKQPERETAIAERVTLAEIAGLKVLTPASAQTA